MFRTMCFKDRWQPLRIGRSGRSQIRLKEDLYVSRHHAVLEPDDDAGQWSLRELSSSNGIFINSKRIAEPVVLLAGMRVRVGYTYLTAVDEQGRVPVLVALVGELCHRLTDIYGGNKAAARYVDVSREFLRVRGQRWKQKQLRRK
ncbi:MAG: FHA domain-containing protein [Myxococcota bacterium]